MTWKKEADALKRRLAVPPPGCQSMEEIAAELDLSVDRAGDVVKRLIKDGRAEAVSGKRLTPQGALANTYYYRLIERTSKKAK